MYASTALAPQLCGPTVDSERGDLVSMFNVTSILAPSWRALGTISQWSAYLQRAYIPGGRRKSRSSNACDRTTLPSMSLFTSCRVKQAHKRTRPAQPQILRTEDNSTGKDNSLSQDVPPSKSFPNSPGPRPILTLSRSCR